MLSTVLTTRTSNVQSEGGVWGLIHQLRVVGSNPEVTGPPVGVLERDGGSEPSGFHYGEWLWTDASAKRLYDSIVHLPVPLNPPSWIAVRTSVT